MSTLVSISKLIAKHINPIPSTIYTLFQSVIAARTAFHSLFEQSVSNQPDPEIERSNVSHKRFIDALTEAFIELGGETWASTQKSEATKPDEENVEEVIFSNAFSALDLTGHSAGEVLDDSDEAGSNGSSKHESSLRQKKKSTRKRKKGKRGKKTKGKARAAVKEPSLDKVPLESYRIIDEDTGLVTDYLMAVYSLFSELIDLRHYVQKLWYDVSYGGLNSAVAGTCSNIAISMIKQTQSGIFVDFIENDTYDTYDTIMNIVTRGNPDKVQIYISALRMEPVSGVAEGIYGKELDVREEFLIHAYHDLLDFIKDFQTTRSGKPTKSMLSEICDWDPNFDLQRATAKQRIKWRRAYTINWLYDLINVFSSIAVQDNTIKGQKLKLEHVDWSIHGAWDQQRRLFGLNEFARDITFLAMQKPGTDVRKKILPHTVFQMQCIVDSLTVSRGWSHSTMKGHVLRQPAQGFRARRDVDLFLDRKDTRVTAGFCTAVDVLSLYCQRDAMSNGYTYRDEGPLLWLMRLRDEFIDCLGESKYMHALNTTILQSRFSNTNSNGLWDYCPFFCGIGLMEALELSYGLGLMMWDQLAQPICIIHLHNMLVQKGCISREIELFTNLQGMFGSAFFAGGNIPTSDFAGAFLAVSDTADSRRATLERRAVKRDACNTAADIHGLLKMNSNRFFKQRSLLMIYREAEWNHERVPDKDIDPSSGLAAARGDAKDIVGPGTSQKKKKVRDNIPLSDLPGSEGIPDEKMTKIPPSSPMQDSTNAEKMFNASLDSLYKDSNKIHILQPKHYCNASRRSFIGGSQLLNFLKFDIANDISADGQPLSSLNYVLTAANFVLVFHEIQEELERVRNPLWVRAYEEGPPELEDKKVLLTWLILSEQNEECMEVVTRMFEKFRIGWMALIYWKDLDNSTLMRSRVNESRGKPCAMM